METEAVHDIPDILESNSDTEKQLLERLSSRDQKALKVAQSSLLGSPVNVESLASNVGVEYEYKSMSDGIFGALTKVEDKEGPERFRITVNEDDIPVRQRFTFAHELAHYFLHAQQLPHGVVQEDIFLRAFTDHYSPKMEREANRMAAHILMPYTKIKLALEKGVPEFREVSLVRLASVFEVSKQAMAIRLELPPVSLEE